MTARRLIKSLLPPALTRRLQRWSGSTLRFSGHPENWAHAMRTSSGYDARLILERVTHATRAVVSGAARYERDSVLFEEPEYPFAVLSALWRAAALGEGRLDVVDFGGSLGSSYRQCRPMLGGLTHLHWQVVEQPSFADAGRREFSTGELSFVDSFENLSPSTGSRAILASSVLQYLEDPYSVLDAFAQLGASHLVIDRTPMRPGLEDRLCIQHVPKQIYAASYPCRLLSRPRLGTRLEPHWRMLCEFSTPEGQRQTDDGLDFEYRGMILERRT